MTPPATTIARALALAAHRLDADAALARVDSVHAPAARALASGWRAAPGAAVTVAAVGAATAELTRARPRGWRRVHPSWVEHALAGEGAAVRAAVLGDGERPVDRFLARWFLGGLVPMDAAGAGAAALVALEPAALTQALVVLGRRQLAHAIAGSPPREIAGLAARLPWGILLITEVATVSRLGDAAAAALGSRRSAVARTTGLTWTDPLALPVVGLRAIASRCAGHGELPRQLAQRLPRPIGQVAALELTGPFASAPADGVTDAEIDAAIARGTVGA